MQENDARSHQATTVEISTAWSHNYVYTLDSPTEIRKDILYSTDVSAIYLESVSAAYLIVEKLSWK